MKKCVFNVYEGNHLADVVVYPVDFLPRVGECVVINANETMCECYVKKIKHVIDGDQHIIIIDVIW